MRGGTSWGGFCIRGGRGRPEQALWARRGGGEASQQRPRRPAERGPGPASGYPPSTAYVIGRAGVTPRDAFPSPIRGLRSSPSSEEGLGWGTVKEGMSEWSRGASNWLRP